MTELPESHEIELGSVDLAAAPSLRARVVTNTFAQLVAPALRVVVSVVLFAILGRYLGVAGFGEYGIVVAWVILFTNALGDWGLATILVREIARRPTERATLIASATLLQLVLAVASYGVILIIAVVSGYSDEVRASLALFGLTLLLAPVQMLTAHFATDLRLTRLVAPGVAGTLTQFALVVLVVAVRGTLLAIMAAGAASVAVEMVWTALVTLRELPFGRPTVTPWRLFLAEAWPLAITTLLTAGVKQAPLLVLSSVGLDAVGIYAAATKIPDYLSRIPYAFRTTMFPLLSRRWHASAGFAELVRLTVAGTLALTVPIALIAFVFGERIVTLVFGGTFGSAAAPFAILMIAFVFVSLGILLESALVAMGRQRTDLVIRATAALVLLGALVAMSPSLGARGSAIAVLVSAGVTVVLMLAVIVRSGRPRAQPPT